MALNSLTELKRVLGTQEDRKSKIMRVASVDNGRVTVQNQESTFLVRTDLGGIVIGDDVIVSGNTTIIGLVKKPSITVFIT